VGVLVGSSTQVHRSISQTLLARSLNRTTFRALSRLLYAKQRWLDEMADQLWRCLAGQTIGYHCAIPD